VKTRDPKNAPTTKVARKAFQRMTRFDITVEGDHPAQATLRAYQESDGRQRMAFDLVMPPKTFMPCADDHRDAVALERTVTLLRSVADELEKRRGRVEMVRIPVVGQVLVPLYGASEPTDVILARARQLLETMGIPENASTLRGPSTTRSVSSRSGTRPMSVQRRRAGCRDDGPKPGKHSDRAQGLRGAREQGGHRAAR
jgi:hypothetical protein